MAWLPIQFPYVFHAEFGRSTPKGVNLNRGEPTKLGRIGALPLDMEGVADPKYHVPPHLCYLAERGSPALKDVGVNRGGPNKLGSSEAPPLAMRGVANV